MPNAHAAQLRFPSSAAPFWALLLWALGPAALAFDSGSGTAEDPWVIVTAQQLYEVRDAPDAHYRLGADIDLELGSYPGAPWWTPIGVWPSSPFTGVFDGDGHTIANLRFDGPANYASLFGFVNGAGIRRVGLIDVEVSAEDFVGGLAGYLQNSEVELVYATGFVTGDSRVGGLIGYSFGSTLDHAYAAVKVTGASGVGGLLGYGEADVVVLSSYYDFDLTSALGLGVAQSTAAMMSAGTLVGWNFSDEGADQWAIVEGRSYPMHRRTFDDIVLRSLSLEAGGTPIALDPDFEPDVLEYDSRVTVTTDTLTVEASAGAAASVSIDGVGGESRDVTLAQGANSITVTVATDRAQRPLPLLPDGPAGPFELDYVLTVVREDGSSSYSHSISTPAQLAAIGSGDYALNHHYVLRADLDLSGYANWQPIGDEMQLFAGEFDGGRHVIRNLTINRPGEGAIGLFGANAGIGWIHDLGLLNVSIIGEDGVGAIVGANAGRLSNVFATGALQGATSVGGLTGVNGDSIENSYFSGTVIGDFAGGLAGLNSSGSVTDSYWDSETSGLLLSGGGGEGKSSAEMRRQSTYAGWDFGAVWGMMEGTTLPMWKSRFDAVKLADLTLTPAQGSATWTPDFTSAQGVYSIELERYASSVLVTASPADDDATVSIAGSSGTSRNVALTAGANVITIDVGTADGQAGSYRLELDVPAQTGGSSPPPSPTTIRGHFINTGILRNITVAPGGVLVGGTLGGRITNRGEIRDVNLLPSTIILGGTLGGVIIGSPIQPAVVTSHIGPGTILSHVIIGDGAQVDPAAVFGPNVRIESPDQLPSGLELTFALPTLGGMGPGLGALDLYWALGSALDAPTLLESLLPPPFLAPIPFYQNPLSGLVSVPGQGFQSHFLPVGLWQGAGTLPPLFDTDGNILLATREGQWLLGLPMPGDSARLQQGLQSLGLDLAFGLTGNLLVAPAAQSGSAAARSRIAAASWFVGRADVLAVPAAPGLEPGLHFRPRVAPLNTEGLVLVYEDEDGELFEQAVVPVPADWAAFKARLQALPGADDVRIDPQGVISLTFEGNPLRGITDYAVFPSSGMPMTGDTADFSAAGDRNGDGIHDLLIHFPDGSTQVLYLLP